MRVFQTSSPRLFHCFPNMHMPFFAVIWSNLFWFFTSGSFVGSIQVGFLETGERPDSDSCSDQAARGGCLRPLSSADAAGTTAVAVAAAAYLASIAYLTAKYHLDLLSWTYPGTVMLTSQQPQLQPLQPQQHCCSSQQQRHLLQVSLGCSCCSSEAYCGVGSFVFNKVF